MAGGRKSTVFRVTGLVRDYPDEDLKALLRVTIEENLSTDEKSQIKTEISIIPSCYESDRERAALVQFHNRVPQFLSELIDNPLGDWQVEMGDSDINFDCHFFGFTQLYTLEEPAIADIIVIPGLDGHAYGSWRGKGNLGRMWLRDFFCKDLPRCRTMIYGYNSKLSSHGVDTILDYGRELMEEVKKIRGTQELQQRPLFFITHSFGGIILAHCLVRAVQTMQDDHPAITSLYRATYGMLLFGTPHRGLMINDIERMVAGQDNHPRHHLLRQISNKSDILILQLADFKNLIRDRRIVSFYETEQTRQLKYDHESRRWKRTGEFITTVEADSALLQLPDHIEDKVPLHADHSTIVKFDSRNAPGYRTALDKLKQFERDAPRVVAARFTQAPDRPRPSSTVPYKRDQAFVGRETIIETLEKQNKDRNLRNHIRVALVGLGGVGKSQIAIEYSYRVRELAPDTWVFWVHASNVTRFEQGYREIASAARIPGRDDPKNNILQLVYQWLRNEKNGHWLIVLDNADDNRVFFDTLVKDRPLADYLPQTPNGSILITSRNKMAVQNLVGSQSHMILVEPMSADEGLALLRNYLPKGQSTSKGLSISKDQSTETGERALVEALEHIPLAISQAGAYIANRSPRMTVSMYLDLFRQSESGQEHLLNYDDAKDFRRDQSIRHPVISTWQISFDQIRHTVPTATDLLALMSMFDRQGIPEDLLNQGMARLEFEDAVSPLMSFSLVRAEIGGQFEMHRLVQLSIRQWLKLQGQLEKWEKESRIVLDKIFPSGDYETWTTCQMLLPHVKEVIRSTIYLDKEDQLNATRITDQCGWYLHLMGKYEEAKAMHQRALEGSEKVLGAKHPSTLSSLNKLGIVLNRQGKYEEAEAMHRRALKGYRKVLDTNNLSTLVSANNLGIVLGNQGKYKEAEAMIQRALQGCEKALGPEHPLTLLGLNNLGLMFGRQGKYKAAEAMYQRALQGREKVLGPEHPNTFNSVGSMGWVLRAQGNYEAAKTMYQRAVQGHEKVLGPEHPDTLTSVRELGLVLTEQGKYEEAEAMHRRVLVGREKVLGAEHPKTLTSVTDLVLVLSKQDKYEEAEAMHRRALVAREKVLGAEHPHTLHSVGNPRAALNNSSRLSRRLRTVTSRLSSWWTSATSMDTREAAALQTNAEAAEPRRI